MNLAAALLSIASTALSGEPGLARGAARADAKRPARFPQRIWAACDFEGRTPDYGWFGAAETKDIPRYPGNATALRGEKAKDAFAWLAGINPVPGPRMGRANKVYFRYRIRGATEAQVQHFNLTKEDNHHVVVSGLTEGRWDEVVLDFTRDSARNDGSPGAMDEGDRMDDLKLFLGRTGDGKDYELLLDDVILFSDEPGDPPRPAGAPATEPFPNRVILLAGFDTGEKEKYWPGDLEVVEKEAPAGASWRAARAVPRKDGRGKLVSLAIAPPRPVGASTRLRFRYHLTGAAAMTVQIFDLTVMDNRHVRLDKLETGSWKEARVDFTRDSRRNDGTKDELKAGNLVDDVFFFVEPEGEKPVELYIDEVVLYDAGPAAPGPQSK